ncbi:MAG: DEAD/DEAH box helicase family protein [Opitutaceae bacterium]|nr:DEAD/DEAH box helicase family protein [Opitutaceae bacterium]
MEIDAKQRLVILSVGEFARFSPYSQRVASTGFGNWRAQVGQQWHQEIQKNAPEEGFANEISISGDLRWNGWTLRLTGRIDQIGDATDRIHVREIKTIATPLPIDPLETASLYKSYCLQLLAYRELLIRERKTPAEQIDLDLLLVEISSGIIQSIRLDTDQYDALIVDHLDRFAAYLDQKSARLARLRELQFKPAYETPRPGQETIQTDLKNAFETSPVVFLEAPTGYGKTGVAWEIALQRLATGQVDRIIYLTSKATGQLEATDRLKALLGGHSSASYWQIRNKAEHCVNSEFRCSPRSCQYISKLDQKWTNSSLDRHILFSTQPIPIEQLKEESAAAGICPYETMRTALGHRDIWIGDYNYLFSSNSAGLLAQQSDFDPSRTFLIIDEAHNLPSRVESNQSKELDALSLNALLEELSDIGAGRRIRNSISSLVSECLAYSKGNTLTLRQLDDLAELLLTLMNVLSSEPLPYDDLSPESLDTLWTLASGTTALKENADRFIAWIPVNGRIRITCIDPSHAIGDTIAKFKECLMLSATFPPFDTFLEQCGLAQRLPLPERLSPPALWLEGAYDIAIDTRADTRMKSRERSSKTTAATIAKLAEQFAPIVVFFPSYAYAQSLREIVERDYPFYRIAMQQRGGGESLAQRADFIDNAIRFHDIVFLTLGSSYAEGIDLIGGKIQAAMVVSPALPEVNPIQNAKRDHYDSKRLNGFERAYLQPGIQKVNQALGRLVRAPGQKVKVLLHCQRYADKQTSNLLSPQYRNFTYLFEDQDLDTWTR